MVEKIDDFLDDFLFEPCGVSGSGDFGMGTTHVSGNVPGIVDPAANLAFYGFWHLAATNQRIPVLILRRRPHLPRFAIKDRCALQLRLRTPFTLSSARLGLATASRVSNPASKTRFPLHSVAEVCRSESIRKCCKTQKSQCSRRVENTVVPEEGVEPTRY